MLKIQVKIRRKREKGEINGLELDNFGKESDKSDEMKSLDHSFRNFVTMSEVKNSNKLELMHKLKGEQDQVRSLVKKFEDKECEITHYSMALDTKNKEETCARLQPPEKMHRGNLERF